jgi:hypothetical protein
MKSSPRLRASDWVASREIELFGFCPGHKWRSPRLRASDWVASREIELFGFCPGHKWRSPRLRASDWVASREIEIVADFAPATNGEARGCGLLIWWPRAKSRLLRILPRPQMAKPAAAGF